MRLQLVEYPEGVCGGEGLDRDSCQALGSGCETHLQPAGRTYVVRYVLDVEKFRKVGAADWSVIEAMRTGNDDTWFGPAAIWLERRGASDDLPFASGLEDLVMYGRLLTYTTVNKSHIWITLQESFQSSCSTGTDGIQINIVEWSLILPPDMSRYRFGESLGRIDGVPGRKD